jgi:hypothetical protein
MQYKSSQKERGMSSATIDLKVWERRWQSLDNTMAYWLETASAHSGIQRQETLQGLLAGLRAFGASQMHFFLQGLAEKPPYRLEPSAHYPWEYVFRTTIDQIGYDLDVILRAGQQRMAGWLPEAAHQTLDLADQLAYRALQPALAQGLIDQDTTVVTYFQKAVNVRLVPYAPVALVGIPFTAIDNPRDLLAIPHEVGHYLFRSGRIAEGRFAAVLSNQLAHQPHWYNAWLEEIFADVYGCLVAGPVSALSFIELVTDDPVDEFLANDHEHPPAAVRPAIYFSALKRMGEAEAVEKLAEHWKKLFEKRGNPEKIDLPDGEEPVPISEVIEQLDHLVALILDDQYLGKLSAQGREGTYKRWSQGEGVEALYEAFLSFKAKVMAESVPLPEIQHLPGSQSGDALSETDATGNGANGQEPKLGATGLWIDAIKAAAERTARQQDPTFAVPPEIWTVLLDAGGWATEGPGGGNPHR